MSASIKTQFVVSILMVMLMVVSAWSNQSEDVLLEQYEFDNEGRPICKIAPDSSKTSYEYNDQGALTKIGYPDDTVSYGYDANGNRIWMQDKTGVTLYCYDAFNRLIAVLHKHSPTRLIVYDYDPWDNLGSISIFNPHLMEQDLKYKNILGTLNNWEWFNTLQEWRDLQFKFQDMIHRLRSEDLERKQSWQEYHVKYDYYNVTRNLKSIDFGAGRIQYSYRPEKSEMIRQLPNGIRSTFSYLPSGELKTIRHEDAKHKTIASYHYEYDSPGKVSSVTERTPGSVRTTSYNWDSRGYLKSYHTPDGNMVSFKYDLMGNRLLREDHAGTIRYKYNNFGRITQTGDLRFHWNKNGNMIRQSSLKQTIDFRYNARNLPTMVKSPKATIHYHWDGAGNMVGRTLNDRTTHYLPYPLAPSGYTLAEYDRTGNMGMSYIYAGDDLLGHLDAKGSMYYYLEDGFKSIRDITDIKGNIVGHQDFTPFAEPLSVKGITQTNFRMAGERFLPEIKSYDIGGRLYEPRMGRYNMPDPSLGYMERFDSFNGYAHDLRTPRAFMEPKCIQTIKTPMSSHYINRSTFLPRIQKPSTIPKSAYIPPMTHRALDYRTPFPARTRSLMELNQQPLPMSLGLTEKELRQRDLAYYAMIDALPRGGLFNTLEPEAVVREYFQAFGLALGTAATGIGRRLLGGWTGIGTELIDQTTPGEKTFVDRTLDALSWVTSPFKSLIGGGLQKMEHHFGRTFERKFGPMSAHGYIYQDPVNSIENQLGGIDLNAPAEFLGNLGRITGAVYDPETQSLSLVGDENISLPPLDIQDLAVALMCVYASFPQDPQFSLDPADPKNPKGEWLKAVYVPEEIIAGTEFGKALFEADWLLKEYSFGISIDTSGRVSKRVSSVPGFKSHVDFYFEDPDKSEQAETWVRFWIVPDSMIIRKQGNSIYFDKCKMRIKAMKMVATPDGLKDVPTEEAPKATAFAELFTQLYDEIARESPEFARVKELAKVVALAKWMKSENIPVDIDWVWEYATQKGDRLVTTSAQTLSLRWERRGEELYSHKGLLWADSPLRGVHIFGGVDLTDRSEYIPDDGTARNLQQEVESALERENIGPLFSVVHQRIPKRAVVLPVTKSGQEMWNRFPVVVQDGVVYQCDPQREFITKATDAEGNISEFTYDPQKRLNTVKISSVDGWTTYGERKDQRTEWSAISPKGDEIVHRYERSGYLREIEVDGERLLTCDYDQDQGQAAIRYKDYVEKLSFDPEGYIEEYELRKVTKDGKLSQEKERVSFTYNDAKRVAKIEGTGVSPIEISYADDGTIPLSVNTPQGQIQFSHDPFQRIQNITLPDKSSVTFSYENESLAKMQVNHPEGKQAEYLFGKDGIVQSRDFLGGVAEYGYEKGLLSSVRLAQGGEAKYIYDDLNRLHQIHFPNGSWIEYQYDGNMVSVITHPVLGVGSEAGQ